MTSPSLTDFTVVGPVHCISCNITFSSQTALDQHLPCSNTEFDLSKVKAEVSSMEEESSQAIFREMLLNSAESTSYDGVHSTAGIKKEIKEEVDSDVLVVDFSKSGSFSSANIPDIQTKVPQALIGQGSSNVTGKGKGRGRGGRPRGFQTRGSSSKRERTIYPLMVFNVPSSNQEKSASKQCAVGKNLLQRPPVQQILPKPPRQDNLEHHDGNLKIDSVFFTNPKLMEEKINSAIVSMAASSMVGTQPIATIFPSASNSFQLNGSPAPVAFPASQNTLNSLQLGSLVLGNTIMQNPQQASFALGVGPSGQIMNPIQNMGALQPNTLLQDLQNLNMTQSLPVQNVSPSLGCIAQSSLNSVSNINQNIQGSPAAALNRITNKVPVLVGNQIILMDVDVPNVTAQSGISSSANTITSSKFKVSQSLPSLFRTPTQVSAPVATTLLSTGTGHCGAGLSSVNATSLQNSRKQELTSSSNNSELRRSPDMPVVKSILSQKELPKPPISSATFKSLPPLTLGVCDNVENKDLKSSVATTNLPNLTPVTATNQLESKGTLAKVASAGLSANNNHPQRKDECKSSLKGVGNSNIDLQCKSRDVSEVKRKNISVLTTSALQHVQSSNSKFSVSSPTRILNPSNIGVSNFPLSFAAVMPQPTSVLSSPHQENVSVASGSIPFANSFLNLGSNPGLAFSNALSMQQPNIVMGGNSGQNVWIQNITNHQPIVIGNSGNQQPLLVGNNTNSQTILLGNQVLNIANPSTAHSGAIQTNVIFPKVHIDTEKKETKLANDDSSVSSEISITTDASSLIKSLSKFCDSQTKLLLEGVGANKKVASKKKTKPSLSQLYDPATGLIQKGTVTVENDIHSDLSMQTTSTQDQKKQDIFKAQGMSNFDGTDTQKATESKEENSYGVKKVGRKKKMSLSQYYDPATGLLQKTGLANLSSFHSKNKTTDVINGQSELGVFFNDKNEDGASSEKGSKVFLGPLSKEELDKIIVNPSQLQKYVSMPSGQIVIAPKAIAVPASSFGNSKAPVMAKKAMNVTDLQKTLFPQPVFINQGSGCHSSNSMTTSVPKFRPSILKSKPSTSTVLSGLNAPLSSTSAGCYEKQSHQIMQRKSTLTNPSPKKLIKRSDNTNSASVFESDKTPNNSEGRKKQKYMSEGRRIEEANETHNRNDLMKLSFVGDINLLKDALRPTTVPLERLSINTDALSLKIHSGKRQKSDRVARGSDSEDSEYSDHRPTLGKIRKTACGERRMQKKLTSINEKEKKWGDAEKKWVPIEVVGDLTIRGKLLKNNSVDGKDYSEDGKRRSNRISSKPRMDYADLEKKPFKDLDDESDSDFEFDKKQSYAILNEVDDGYIQSEADNDFKTAEEKLSVYDEDTDVSNTEADSGESNIEAKGLLSSSFQVEEKVAVPLSFQGTEDDHTLKAVAEKQCTYDEDTNVFDTEPKSVSWQGLKSETSPSSCSPSVLKQVLKNDHISVDTENSTGSAKREKSSANINNTLSSPVSQSSEEKRMEDTEICKEQFEECYYSSESESDMYDPDLESASNADKMKNMLKHHSEVTLFLVKNASLFSPMNEKDEHNCLVCNKYRTNGIFSLSKHLKKHLSGCLKCSKCSYEASHEKNLEEHFDRMHKHKM